MAVVQLTMRSATLWQTLPQCDDLVDRLTAVGGFVLPEKFDDHEPERHTLDPGDRAKLHQIWRSPIGSVFFKRRQPAIAWLTFLLIGPQIRLPCELRGGFDERYARGEDLARLLEGARQLYQWGAVDHGFLAHDDDWNAKNFFGVPTRVGGGKMLATGGLHLEDGLPGIYWANFFGPRYVDFLGGERFASAPAHHKERLADGGWLLLTAPGPLDHGRAETRACEQALLDHLGRDAFFERARPTRQCRAPELGLGQAKGAAGDADAATGAVVDFDPIQFVIPAADIFTAEAAMLANSLVKRLDGRLDYSVESLETVDAFVTKRSYRRPEPWSTAQGRALLRELTAYYGEVLRRHLRGAWRVDAATGHPAIDYRAGGEILRELPFARVVRLWCERDPGDRLAVTFPMVEAGAMGVVQGFLKRFF